jgi:hypothetical protein
LLRESRAIYLSPLAGRGKVLHAQRENKRSINDLQKICSLVTPITAAAYSATL